MLALMCCIYVKGKKIWTGVRHGERERGTRWTFVPRRLNQDPACTIAMPSEVTHSGCVFVELLSLSFPNERKKRKKRRKKVSQSK
jgi:hypothetical protein